MADTPEEAAFRTEARAWLKTHGAEYAEPPAEPWPEQELVDHGSAGSSAYSAALTFSQARASARNSASAALSAVSISGVPSMTNTFPWSASAALNWYREPRPRAGREARLIKDHCNLACPSGNQMANRGAGHARPHPGRRGAPMGSSGPERPSWRISSDRS